MNLLSLVLFILGVLFLILGWRWQTPQSQSPEILAALRGIANVKREVSDLKKSIDTLKADLSSGFNKTNNKTNFDDFLDYYKEAQEQYNPQISFEYFDRDSRKGPEILKHKDEGISESETWNPLPQGSLSPKYKLVLELAKQGFSVADIASHLAISQDAVNMVLRTRQRGGRV